MPNITNKYGLPQPLYIAAHLDPYHRGDADISVTELIDSPRIRLLKQIYGDTIDIDVTEEIWPMLGTAFHNLMEEGGDEHDCIKEERLFAEINGWVVSGKFDRVNDVSSPEPILQDYKVTSVFAVMKGRLEWTEQLNCYRWLYHHNYVKEDPQLRVPEAQIVALCRDWRPNEVDRMARYPEVPCVKIDIKSWVLPEIEKYMVKRVELHQEAQRAYDEDGVLPECSLADVWGEPDKWVVETKAQGKNPRTSGTFKTEIEAKAFYAGGPTTVRSNVKCLPPRKKYGEWKRCERYCEFSSVCLQWRDRQQMIAAEQALHEIDKGTS